MAKDDYMQNRELSWLTFNDRVLSEATDDSVPLFERLKFISIFTSNLDEFFMIRVGSLFDLASIQENSIDKRSGWTPNKQLEAIYKEMPHLYRKRALVYEAVNKRLCANGVERVGYDELSPQDKKYCNKYFKMSVEPILSPQIVDTHHPFPHLKNKVLHVGVWLKYKSKEMFGVIPVPETVKPVLVLPGDKIKYIQTEEILLSRVEEIFANYTVLEKTIFCITRNADVNPDGESYEFASDDFRKKMKKVLKKRMRLAPVRLELSNNIGDNFLNYLKCRLPVTDRQIFVTTAPLNMGYVYSLEDEMSEEIKEKLTYPKFEPRLPADFNVKESVIRQVLKKDRMLSYPFESMQPFLDLVREASNDKNVLSIKITIYRLARQTKLIDYLCTAAERGKDVVVFIELRARFDEQNNIDWSERLEDAGCTVYYGFENYKIHSKICLITRKERGEIKYITQIGTGNYNEKTAKQYTDVSFITADQRIGKDAAEFFKNMAIGNLDGRYNELLVAPVSLKSTIMRLLDEEISKGEYGRAVIKINSITDVELIEKLKEASCAGVKIDLIVRGICCILPGVPGKTENIRVISIVGRYLEHSRIYCFGEGNEEKIYISSADFMTRNTQRRVEIACPIYDPEIRSKLRHILNICLSDNVKGRELLKDGTYITRAQTEPLIDSQKVMMGEASRGKVRLLPDGNRRENSVLQGMKERVTKVLSFIGK